MGILSWIVLGLIVTPGGGEWWEAAKFLYPAETAGRVDQRLGDPDSLPPPWFKAPFYGLDESDYAVFRTAREEKWRTLPPRGGSVMVALLPLAR